MRSSYKKELKWNRTTLTSASCNSGFFLALAGFSFDSGDIDGRCCTGTTQAAQFTSGCRSSPSGCGRGPSRRRRQRRWPCSRCQRRRCRAGGPGRFGRRPWRRGRRRSDRRESGTSAISSSTNQQSICPNHAKARMLLRVQNYGKRV